MASSKSSIINLIKEYILRLKENNISVEKVLLFGSIMRGTSREDSDIDIAVISSSFNPGGHPKYPTCGTMCPN